MNIRRSKLSKNKRRKLLEHFVAGTTARTAASIIGVNKNTAQLFFHKLREIIGKEQLGCKQPSFQTTLSCFPHIS